jgi:hypothetical protein
MSEIAESTIFSKQNYIPRLHNTATLSLQHIVTRQCADTPTNPGQTNPGQTNPGQTNPGHDKPWTGQTLDRTNPGHDKPWTEYNRGHAHTWQCKLRFCVHNFADFSLVLLI